MRVLLVGASGFIGSAVEARLVADGHQVRAVVHRRRAGASAERVVDIAQATASADWLAHVRDVDAVVNCAGVLQDSPRDSTQGVHATGIGALFRACETAGVRRIVHFSAIGVDREAPTPFSRSKREGEKLLMSLDLDWVVLRPSVVVGRAAYGGSALFRGLAALPVLPVLPDSAPLQIVQLDDVVETVAFFLDPGAPARVAVDVAGPERMAMEEAVATYRRWLGWRPARRAHLPKLAWRALFALGDAARWLGWRPPVGSTAGREMMRGAIGDNGPWQRLTGIAPMSLAAALAREPASVQERWFSRLYLLKPLVFGIFSLFWILTGLISLGPGWGVGMELLLDGGLAPPLAAAAIVAGALADLAIGLGIAVRRTTRPALYAALAISLAYAALGTAIAPGLWSDPLGPMLKIWVIMALNMVAIAILEDR